MQAFDDDVALIILNSLKIAKKQKQINHQNYKQNKPIKQSGSYFNSLLHLKTELHINVPIFLKVIFQKSCTRFSVCDKQYPVTHLSSVTVMR